MKYTDLQKHRIKTAFNEAAAVLSEIKRQPLASKDLENMKILESAVQALEVMYMVMR